MRFAATTPGTRTYLRVQMWKAQAAAAQAANVEIRKALDEARRRGFTPVVKELREQMDQNTRTYSYWMRKVLVVWPQNQPVC